MKQIIAAMLLCASTFTYAGDDSKPCMVKIPSSEPMWIRADAILEVYQFENKLRMRVDNPVGARIGYEVEFRNPREIPKAIEQLVQQINRCQNGG